MKKKILSFVFFVVLLSLFTVVKMDLLLQTGNKESTNVSYTIKEKPFTIAVATDLHYLSSKLTDNGIFFTKMMDHADGKNMHYIEEITDAFVDTILEKNPEFLILSGDLTFNGEKQSHIDLEKKLSIIRKNGTKVLVLPGNHDIDRSSAAAFFGEGYQLVESISKEKFADIYQNDGLSEASKRDRHSLSYVYKARNDFWILMVDSNSQQTNRISEQTYDWIEENLKEAQSKNVHVLAVSHQNIASHNPRFKKGFLIDHANRLKDLYDRYKVLVNLSGHIHIQHINQKTVPEILTSALPVSPHHYALVTVDGQKLEYQAKKLDVENWSVKKKLTDKNMLNFSNLSREYMEKVSVNKLQERLVDNTLTEHERILMGQTFAKLNADYFAGAHIPIQTYQEGLDVWQEKGRDFYKHYIKTILSSGKKEQLHFVLKLE